MTTVKKTKKNNWKVVETPVGYQARGPRRSVSIMYYDKEVQALIKDESKYYALYMSGCKAKKLAKLLQARLDARGYKTYYRYEAVPMGTK